MKSLSIHLWPTKLKSPNWSSSSGAARRPSEPACIFFQTAFYFVASARLELSALRPRTRRREQKIPVIALVSSNCATPASLQTGVFKLDLLLRPVRIYIHPLGRVRRRRRRRPQTSPDVMPTAIVSPPRVLLALSLSLSRRGVSVVLDGGRLCSRCRLLPEGLSTRAS